MGQILSSTHSLASSPIFEPIRTGSEKWHIRLKNFSPEQERMRLLRHPNLATYARQKKDVLVALPFCIPLSEYFVSFPKLFLSEVIYGLRGISSALRTCAQAECYFKTLGVHQIGVVMACEDGCHPLHANRWIIVDFSGANGNGVKDSVYAFIELAYWCIVTVDPDLMGLVAYPEKAVDDIVQWLEKYTTLDNHNEGVSVSNSTDSDTVFAVLDDLICRLEDPLIKAMEIAIDLPACFGHDSATEDSTLGQLTVAYDSLKNIIVILLQMEGGLQVLEKCVLPWLLDPVHMSTIASSPLFDLIFKLPSMKKDNSSMKVFIHKCIQSSDPNIYIRLCAHMSSLVRFIEDEDIILLYFGTQYTIFHTTCSLKGKWITDTCQLHYCHCALRSMVPVVIEMIRRSMEEKYIILLVKPLIYLFEECVHAMEHQGCICLGDVSRLLRDTVVGLCVLSPYLPENMKMEVCSVMYKGPSSIQEQVIHIVVGCIGTTIPLDRSVFLWPTFLTLARSKEPSVCVATCTALLRLRDAVPCGVPSELYTCVYTDTQRCKGSMHNMGDMSNKSDHANSIPSPTAMDITQCVHAFVSYIARYFHKSDNTLINDLAKERSKSSKLLMSKANTVFRTGNDKVVFTTVLPVAVL